MNGQRQKPNDKKRGYPLAIDLAYNDPAGALRTIPVMPKFASYGVALDTAQGYDMGSMLGIFNSDTAVHYIATGPDNTVAAPTGPTDGIPVLPGQMVYVALGDDKYIIADAATVFAYEIDDDTNVAPHTDPNT